VTRTAKDRLADVLAAVATIRTHVETAERHGLSKEEALVLDAVVRQLAIIGEAVSALPEDLLALRRDIPWSDIVGMRILLDHHDYKIHPETVWNTVEDQLPSLEEAVRDITARQR
jgi:uncharacterized protein with HEPN domain